MPLDLRRIARNTVANEVVKQSDLNAGTRMANLDSSKTSIPFRSNQIPTILSLILTRKHKRGLTHPRNTFTKPRQSSPKPPCLPTTAVDSARSPFPSSWVTHHLTWGKAIQKSPTVPDKPPNARDQSTGKSYIGSGKVRKGRQPSGHGKRLLYPQAAAVCWSRDAVAARLDLTGTWWLSPPGE